jgi:hypothetical protein
VVAIRRGFRGWGPLASPQDWAGALQPSGFSGVDIDFFDFPDEKSQLVSYLVATASGVDMNGSTADDNLAIIFEKSELQTNAATAIKSLLKERTGTSASLVSVSEIANTDLNKSLCFFLADLGEPFRENTSKEAYSALKYLTSSTSGPLWLTQGGDPSPRNAKADLVTGFARCKSAENPGLRFITLSVDKIKDALPKIYNTCCSKSLDQKTDNGLYEKDVIIYVGRIIEAIAMNKIIASRSTSQKAVEGPYNTDCPLTLAIGSPGLLDTLQFQDDSFYDKPLGPNDVEVEIGATGLSLLDIMIALGQVIEDAFGQEGAGIVTRAGKDSPLKPGDRVCGLVRGTFKTYVRAAYYQWSKMLDNLSFTTAAALPVVYCTAYYGLHDIAHLQKGKTVLIHWGAGGLGQAAIQPALLAGANVIATVGSLQKRDFIRDTYGILESHIIGEPRSVICPGRDASDQRPWCRRRAQLHVRSGLALQLAVHRVNRKVRRGRQGRHLQLRLFAHDPFREECQLLLHRCWSAGHQRRTAVQ